MRRVIAVAATGIVLLTGCATTDAKPSITTPAAGQTMPPSTDACPGMLTATGGEEIRFGTDDATNLGGVLAGAGATGIVLTHQNGGSVCEWKDIAPELIGKGYRVLAFDFQGFGVSQTRDGTSLDSDVAAAAARHRGAGAPHVAQVRASMGGTYSLAAAPAIDPPVAALIAASSPAVFNKISAEEAVPKLTMPVLFVANENDGQYGADAEAMHRAAKASPDAQLKVTPGSAHGVDLLAPTGDKTIRDTVRAFLTEHAPVG
jgi:pimeloyl-ACP methyl ester carboxylesterase